MISELFRLLSLQGQPANSLYLSRLLELFRMPQTQTENIIALVLTLEFIRFSISSGADPNIVCRSIQCDSDKSHLTMLAMLDRLITSSHLLAVAPSLPQKIEPIRKEIYSVGGRAIMIPFEAHRTAEIGITSVDVVKYLESKMSNLPASSYAHVKWRVAETLSNELRRKLQDTLRDSGES